MEYTMLSLKSILFDAEEKQEQEQNHDLRKWLKELQNTFYQIEDTMDEFKWDFEQEGTGKKVQAPFSCSHPISAHKFIRFRKMMRLRNHLDTLAARMYEFHLTEKHPDSIGRRKTAHSFLSTTEVSVRHMKPSWQLQYTLTDAPMTYDGDRYAELLTTFKSIHGFFLIVGEAGIGKSTLAKFLYNDKEVVEQYLSRFWVCVKEGFDTQRLIEEVYSVVACKEICNDLTKKQLHLKVQHLLKGTSFLLVIQDLSTTNLDDSSTLMELLGMGNKNSKILVTTQSEETAGALGLGIVYASEKQSEKQSTQNSDDKNQKVSTVFKLERLSEDKSSKLFKRYAFRDRQEVNNEEFTGIEDQILQKCKGVPLAIKCMGSLLSSKTRIAEWKNIKDKLWAQKEENDGILHILRLCYNQMPSHLKPCFLHCAQLPDRILSSNDVIQLWMAHGLLHSPEENHASMKNIGEKYFMELWSRCFVQEIEEHGLGYWFKLHPLIQKLAHVLAQEQSEGLVGTKPVTEIKSLAFHVRDMVPPNASLPGMCILKYNSLRVLHLGNANIEEIPNAIGTLKSLRYLDLHGNKNIKRLPNSICNLQSLQTLILESCSELKELPTDIRNLISLKYLWITTKELYLHKNGVGTMTSLQFLAIGGCKNLKILFERPECLADLETLMIYNCNTLKSLPNEMIHLKSLQNLVIWGCKQLTLTLENAEFRLQRFTIRELPGVDELPEWLDGSIETLRNLQIINCPITINVGRLQAFTGVETAKIVGSVKVKGAAPGYGFQYWNTVIRGSSGSGSRKYY
ncbi:disease resistance protein RGA2-like [Cucurbita moschata]|uniref:Disease resistance protein RGA2-like n=1 Tax=Cucurbita moschata TaxID=3662 RepID=A0A6J1F328_CUCMO|nr:disease resistance protein RGA2-like [Cucurbita moschata]